MTWKALFGVIFAAICILGILFTTSCENGPPNITGTIVPDLPTAVTENRSSHPANPDQDSPPENFGPEAPRQAAGVLIVEGLYARCIQSTSYPLDTLSVFRVREDGGQSAYASYRPPEGTLPCGQRLQVDCTVRTQEVIPGAIPAYDLYDFLVFTSDTCASGCQGSACGTPKCEPVEPAPNREGCTWNTTTCEWDCPPCEGEWVEAFREVTHEGECEQRVKVTRIVEVHTCTEEERVTVERERAPGECSSDECELPSAGSHQFDRPFGSPEAECNHFGLTEGHGGFFIMKCGLFYQWGPQAFGTCTNGQDISHTTQCKCPEDD